MVELIDTEVFKKLTQLDRIEYMLGFKRIDEKYSSSTFYTVVLILFFYFGFSLIIMITGYSAFGIEWISRVFLSFKLSFKIIILLLISVIVFDIFMYIKKNIAKRIFNKEFFKIEVNKK